MTHMSHAVGEKLKPSLRESRQKSECFCLCEQFAHDATVRIAADRWPLLVTYTKQAHINETVGPILPTIRRPNLRVRSSPLPGLVVREVGFGICCPFFKDDHWQRALAKKIQGLLSEIRSSWNRGSWFPRTPQPSHSSVSIRRVSDPHALLNVARISRALLVACCPGRS